MTTAQIKASLALWQRRLAVREKLQATAHRDLDKARAAGAHPRQSLVDRAAQRDLQVKEAHGRIALRRKQLRGKHKHAVREPAHSTRSTPNQSSRGGADIRVIVVHDTEGGFDGSVNWLCNSAAQASAHVVVSKRGESVRLVADSAKAWHVANDNPFTLGIEQEGYATQTHWPDAQIREVAKWLAYWSQEHDIPLRHSTVHGVCQHKDLGAAGGGHHDCGEHYPFARLLDLAQGYRGA